MIFQYNYVQVMTEEAQECPCPTFRSRMTSDLIEAAKLLDAGHVIGIPTDTVYALAGSCKCPESVSKIYHIKGRPPEKPICLCISSLDQLKVAKPPFRYVNLIKPNLLSIVNHFKFICMKAKSRKQRWYLWRKVEKGQDKGK